MLDSGVLQYIPKGAYYEGQDEQFKHVKAMWDELLAYDRVLFCLMSLLNGSGFAKGMITHMLLSSPFDEGTGKDLIPAGLDDDFEKNVILYNLNKIASESMPRALKNLLILAGNDKNAQRINNSRTRKIILEFIFNRDNKELDSLAVNFKSKLATLVRHAVGKQDLYKILHNNKKLFQKLIGRYNRHSMPVVFHLFNKPVIVSGARPYFPQISLYWEAREAAKSGNVEKFTSLMNKLPFRTVIGFRNTYKLPVDLAETMQKTKMSDREKMQSQSAIKRAGGKVRKVNYAKQDIYDLWKLFYVKLLNDDSSETESILKAIAVVDKKLEKVDFGECSVIIDASHSMRGSDERPLHPMLTTLCIFSKIKNVKNVTYIGGKWLTFSDGSKFEGLKIRGVVPQGSSPIWKGLLEAVSSGLKTIILISDGYENAVKGMFEHVYDHFKNTGNDFELIHINPVFSADAKTGTTRRLVKDIDPLPVNDYKNLETEFIFRKLLDNTDLVKQLLVQRYQKLIGGKA
jgi:hypothetical protein